MSIFEMLYLCGVVAAFGAFTLVLAWGEYQTRNFVRPEAPKAAVKDRNKVEFKSAA